MLRGLPMKTYCLTAIGFCFLQLTSVAATVSLETAKTVAEKWVTARTAFRSRNVIGCTTKDYRTVRDSSSLPLFHVIRFNEGGFAVVSADDRLAPVIAFSSASDLIESEANPLWILLRRDVPLRKNLSEKVSSVNQSATSAWRKLGAPISRSGVPDASVDDVRVSPLVKSRWNQGSVAGKPVFDYYVPGDGMPCGCVATAAAQVMRYHEFPKDRVEARKYTCTVSGRDQELETYGGIYDWALMPLIPDGTISDEACEMIGRLTYDVGVASCMSYSTGGSGTLAYYTEKALKELFRYGQAVYVEQFDEKNGVMGQLQNAVLANLDAGLPVMMGISGKDVWTRQNVGHEIVGDGYGYVEGTLYVHLNLGWSGNWDAWYNLPHIDAYSGRDGCDFNLFDDLVFNICTNGTAEIVSGRVTDNEGLPVGGAEVFACDGENRVIDTAKTSESGVYALRVPPNSTVRVRAELGSSESEQLVVSTGKSRTFSPYFGEKLAPDFAGAVGNRWGNDLRIAAETCVEPSFSHQPCAFVGSFTLDCSQPNPEACIRYTLDGTEPTEDSPLWPSGGIVLDRTATVSVRTVCAGMVASPVVSGVFSDRPFAVLSYEGELIWDESVGASCYKVYRSSNRFGSQLEEVSGWISDTSFHVERPTDVNDVYFYFVRAASEAGDVFASPLSDAVICAVQDDSASGVAQPISYVPIEGDTVTSFLIEDFPIVIPEVRYSTDGSFGENGFSKVTFPTTSRTDIPLPESADGTIKTTKVGASARFGEAHGMFHMDDNSGNATARAWRMKMFYVKNKETNYVNTSSTESVPVCFHYFQQCAPALGFDHEAFQCSSSAATDDVSVQCSREYEWEVESDSEWVSVSRAHGRGPCVVRLSVSPNDGDAERTAVIVVRCGSEASSFTVKQGSAQSPFIDDRVFLSATQGIKSSSVFLSWNTISGMTAYEIFRSMTPDVVPDEPYWVSSNQIPVLVDFGVSPGRSYYYWVSAVTTRGRTQVSNCAMGYVLPTAKPDRERVDFDAACETNRIVVLSNAGWEAVTDAQWLSLTALDTERNGVLDVAAEKNHDYSPRSAEILVIGGSSTEFPVTNVVIVTQAGASPIQIERTMTKGAAREIAAVQLPDSGEDPTVRLSIEMNGDMPKLTWWSELSEDEQAKRVYTVVGCRELGKECQWQPVFSADAQVIRQMRFFKVLSQYR